MKKDPLDIEKRRRIFRFVEENPGAYMREIQKALGLGTGVLEYHLSFLVKNGLLSVYPDGKKRRYFSVEKVSAPQRELLSFLRQKHTRRILTLSLAPEGASVEEIKKACGISKSGALFYISKLEDAGLLEERTDEGGRRFFARNPESLYNLLITYRESFLDDLVDRFLDSFMDI